MGLRSRIYSVADTSSPSHIAFSLLAHRPLAAVALEEPVGGDHRSRREIEASGRLGRLENYAEIGSEERAFSRNDALLRSLGLSSTACQCNGTAMTLRSQGDGSSPGCLHRKIEKAKETKTRFHVKVMVDSAPTRTEARVCMTRAMAGRTVGRSGPRLKARS